jgi:hypothetical protein
MGIHQALLASDRDPYWSNVVLLLTASGSVGATSFVDQSRYANALTTFGGAIISNAQSIFNGKSIESPNPPVDSGITFNGSQPHFNFGTNSITIEMFRYVPIGTASAAFYRFNLSTGNPIWSFLSSSNHNIGFRVGASVVGTLSGYSFEGSVWRHEALVYDSDPGAGTTEVSFFCNGLRYFNNSYASGSGISLAGSSAIGNRIATMSAPLDGWFDQFRVTNGVARYRGATYAVPTEPFPAG